MSKFKVGDRVKIAKTSQYYPYRSRANGIITEFDSDSIQVKFDDGNQNSYREIDLVLLNNQKLMTPTHVVVLEEDRDPAKFFTSKKDADDFIKDLSDRQEVKKDSIVIAEVKNVKKVSIYKQLKTTQYKI